MKRALKAESHPLRPSVPEASATGQVKQDVWTSKEWLRLKDGALGSSRLELSAAPEATSILRKMFARGDYTRDLWERIPFPTCPSPKSHPAVTRRDGLISENVSYGGFAIFAPKAATETARTN